MDTIQLLQDQELTEFYDAALVTWPVGKKKPETRQLHKLAGTGALKGTFWGLLFGILFFVPLFGAAIGAALRGAMSDVGIDDEFIKKARTPPGGPVCGSRAFSGGYGNDERPVTSA